jgi:hypothetical protein
VLAVTAAVAWYLVVRRRLSSVETMLSLLAWLVGLAVALAVLSPEVAYLAIWPAIVGSAGLAADCGSAVATCAGPQWAVPRPRW